ncbi:MAG: YdeI/OmpD-associated family protein [Gemmatimonadaceae bacterium]
MSGLETDPVLSFKSARSWDTGLAKSHASGEGVWLRIFKKDSGQKTVTYAEALDVALCYGWIDGLKRSYDDTSFLQRFTPRRIRSAWSKVNTEHVERLTKAGRMKPAGVRAVEAARGDGRWARAYESPKNANVPEDFLSALKKNKEAYAFFETLNRANLYAIAYRLSTAKKAETRERRMAQILEMLAKGERFH